MAVDSGEVRLCMPKDAMHGRIRYSAYEEESEKSNERREISSARFS